MDIFLECICGHKFVINLEDKFYIRINHICPHCEKEGSWVLQ